MEAYTPGEQPGDPDIIKLNTNEFPYPPAPQVIDALRREIDGQAGDNLRKYPNPAASALRQALAEEHGLEADWILAGNGSDEVLRLIFQAYLNPGDEVAILQPTYSLYPVLCEMFEARLTRHPAGEDGQLPESIFRGAPRVIAISNPNPPLGTFYHLGGLVRLAQETNNLLLIDEAYAAFAPHDCIGIVKRHPNVVVSRTFSKSHALAGMRVGYLIAHPDIIRQLDKIRDSYNMNRLSQAAALAALKARDYYAERIKRIIASRDFLQDELAKLGYRVPESQANFLFARSGDGKQTLEGLRKQNILVRYFDDADLRDGTRITVGTPGEIEKLLDALKNLPNPYA